MYSNKNKECLDEVISSLDMFDLEVMSLKTANVKNVSGKKWLDNQETCHNYEKCNVYIM